MKNIDALNPALKNLENKGAASSAQAHAIKSSYKKWEKELSYEHFAKTLETCYNNYIEASFIAPGTPDSANWTSQALAIKKLQEMIKRQLS